MSRVRRIDAGLFPGAPPWLPRFVALINQALADLAANAPKLLPSSSRVARQVLVNYLELEFHAPENLEDAFPLYLEHSLPAAPQLVDVAKCFDLTDPLGRQVSAVQPTWEMSADGRVAVRHISGLVALHDYRLRFVMQT